MFGEFLRKDSYEIEFERLGIRTPIRPLSGDELEECRRMRGTDGGRYALYLACPALHEEGERLYKEGVIFSPLDITMAIDISDVNGAYQHIKEISGEGQSRVKLFRNSLPAFGADESFDEISRDLSVPVGNYDDISDDGEMWGNMPDDGENGRNMSDNGRAWGKMPAKGEKARKMPEDVIDMDTYTRMLAHKLRMAAENM